MVKRREVIKLFKSYGFEIVCGTNHDKLIHPMADEQHLNGTLKSTMKCLNS